jgi:hypothetical protein
VAAAWIPDYLGTQDRIRLFSGPSDDERRSPKWLARRDSGGLGWHRFGTVRWRQPFRLLSEPGDEKASPVEAPAIHSYADATATAPAAPAAVTNQLQPQKPAAQRSQGLPRRQKRRKVDCDPTQLESAPSSVEAEWEAPALEGDFEEVQAKRKKRMSGKKKKAPAVAAALPETSTEATGESNQGNTAENRVRVPALILYGVKDIRTLSLSLAAEVGDDYEFFVRRTTIRPLVSTPEHH